jgi:ADP-ribosylglycohydrolase
MDLLGPDTAYQGCLIGGAIGDALGAPVEFMSMAQILQHYGQGGIQGLDESYGVHGAITDDTQMTLFTAEGLLRAYVRHSCKGICHIPSVVAHAYLRWLRTQSVTSPSVEVSMDGFLITNTDLYQRRAPGKTCISALQAMRSLGEPVTNDSKGCGSVMRAAPVGLALAHQEEDGLQMAFQLGIEIAALTHGHITGQLSAAFLSGLICLLAQGQPLENAINRCLETLNGYEGAIETRAAIENAKLAAEQQPSDMQTLVSLGEGWIAEEALAMAIYCCLSANDFRQAVLLSVNHGGDSDSTGSITGNIMGVIGGLEAIPSHWVDQVELSPLIQSIAKDLLEFPTWNIGEYTSGPEADAIWDRYPGH